MAFVHFARKFYSDSRIALTSADSHIPVNVRMISVSYLHEHQWVWRSAAQRLSPWRWMRGHLHGDGSEGPLAAKVADQGQGENDCSHSDRKSKSSTPQRGSRKKVQFHKPNYFWDGGEKNITAITAPGMRGGKEREAAEEQEEQEGGPEQNPNYRSHQISKQRDARLAACHADLQSVVFHAVHHPVYF